MNRSRPAFGPAAEQSYGTVVEIHGEATAEQLRRLRPREGEVVRAELNEIARCPEAAEGQPRIGSAGDGQLHPRWKVIDQVADRAMDALSGDHVIVVEHQQEVPVELRSTR